MSFGHRAPRASPAELGAAARAALNRRARGFLAAGLLAAAGACEQPVSPQAEMRPQSVVLIATPKIIADFASPDTSVAAFLDAYAPLTARAHETVVVFAVGNSEHVLTYRGSAHWADSLEWARYTNGIRDSWRTLSYAHVAGIVQAFRRYADSAGMRIKVLDQVDQTNEFTHEYWKLDRHPECWSTKWESFDIRGILTADSYAYASAPAGTPAGKRCGEFLADQVAAYVDDLGFDGIMYGNQLGTRGRWLPENGPGYSASESAAILKFIQYTRQALGDRTLLWFDSYNNVDVERQTWSFPRRGYRHFDYVIAAGFAVVTFPTRYRDNIGSKLGLRDETKVLATLDYVDPWYDYDTMTDYPDRGAELEQVAVERRFDVDGLAFFANDEHGRPIPWVRIAAFASRYFADPR